MSFTCWVDHNHKKMENAFLLITVHQNIRCTEINIWWPQCFDTIKPLQKMNSKRAIQICGCFDIIWGMLQSPHLHTDLIFSSATVFILSSGAEASVNVYDKRFTYVMIYSLNCKPTSLLLFIDTPNFHFSKVWKYFLWYFFKGVQLHAVTGNKVRLGIDGQYLSSCKLAA